MIFQKKGHINVVWITFYMFLKPFEKTKFLKFGSHLKGLNCPTPHPYIQIKFKTGLNACIWGLNFLGYEAPLAPLFRYCLYVPKLHWSIMHNPLPNP